MSGNREQDDEQALLQRALGGGPVNTAQPVGQPVREPEPAAAAPDTSQSSRDALGGYAGVGNMHGFRTDDYGGDVKARNSVKNTFGRIASRYKHAPSQIDAVMADADFQRYFPGAQKVQGGAGDKINFGGVLSDFESGVPVYEVDVLGAADPNSDSAMGWTWQDQVNDGGGMPAGDPMGGGMDPMGLLGGQGANGLDALAQSDVLARIMSELQGAGGDGQEQALLQSLLGGR